MSAPITNLQAAQRDAIMNRPAVNGFPHLAETLRRAGVRTNTWWLPAMQSLYETDYGPVLDQGVPLIDGVAEVPAFDRTALVTALRADQAGQTSFREFAAAACEPVCSATSWTSRTAPAPTSACMIRRIWSTTRQWSLPVVPLRVELRPSQRHSSRPRRQSWAA